MEGNIINKLLLKLIMKKMKIHKNQAFRFTNQKDKCFYYFTKTDLMKAYDFKHKKDCDLREVRYGNTTVWAKKSGISLNWILNISKDDVIYC